MKPEVFEAVKVLMAALKPGETVRFDLQLAAQVVAPGKRSRVATLIVTLPLVTSQARTVVTGLGQEDN